MAKKLLIALAVVVVVGVVSLFLPSQEMKIEGVGRLSFETKVTLSVGSEAAYAAPDEEIRQPDGDISTGAWATPPLWSKIDEGSTTPDGVYIICPGNRNSTGECSVQNPTNPGTYTAVEIRVYARKSAAGGNQRGLDANIRINGTLQGQRTLTANLTNVWTQYTTTWSGLNFSQAEMNSLQIQFISTGQIGGAAGLRRQVWIDYYEVVLTYTPSLPPPSCWPSGWSKRVSLTIDHNDISSPLTNFPVLVYLSNSSGRNNADVSFVFDELQSAANRFKISVHTADCTECYVEIEKWDQVNEEAWLWVRVPSISNTTDTVLYLYYDRTHADNTAYVGDTNSTPAEMVWDSNFAMVQHLGEDSEVVHDSTANNNDETNPPPSPPSPGYYRATYNDNSTIDGGYAFSNDGTYGSRLQMAHSPSLDITEAITLEAWVYLNDTTNAKFVVKDDPFDVGGPGCYNLQQEARGGIPSLELQLDLGGTWTRASYSTYSTGQWLYVVGTYDRSMMRLYLNGTEVATNPQTAAISSRTVNLALGNRADDWGLLYDLNGLLDEVRISNTARSPAWIYASYESGRDDLISYGPEETIDITNAPSTLNFGYVAENSSYWANGAEPVFPLDDDECYFTLTNNSTVPVNISIRATNFSGGVGWTLGSSPGENIVTLKVGKSGDGEGDLITLTTTDQSFISNLPASSSRKWELKLETGTFTDEVEKTSIITLTATAS